MAAENFAEFLNKLKELHEKEVQGLQTKLNELTNERCRDTQRIEELFAKNHQLREQQKVLKENVKVLENRLRAGLCDRCQVTQELAKKKQREFGKAHFQSLQHIFILSNEMNKVREENKSLREEMKRLCSTEDRQKPLRGPSREGSSNPNSPLPLISTQSRKSSAEKSTSREAEDEYDEPFDQSPGQRSSPSSRVSPNILLQGEHALEMHSSQRIANQLHGTIALLRPGSRSCSQERDCPGSATPPPASGTPPPPASDRIPSFEAYLRASKSDCRELASSYKALKFAARKEQSCLPSQHFALHHLGLQSNSSSRESGFPHRLLMAREAEGRMKSQDDWEDQAAILDLPGAMVYMKDRHLENRLQFLNHQEKLRYLLMQQQECNAKMEDGLDRADRRSPSPLLRAGKECKKERSSSGDSSEGTLGRFLLIDREELEQAEKAEVMREYLTEVPLDLSDYGRGREKLKAANRQPSSGEEEPGSPIKRSAEDPILHKSDLSTWLHTAERLHKGKESEQLSSSTHDIVTSLNTHMNKRPTYKPVSCDATADSETKVPFEAQKQKVEQPGSGDSESVNEESDEPKTSDSEVIGACDDESLRAAPMKEKYCCTTEITQRSQKKRKRGRDSPTKAFKKPVQGRRNGKAAQILADVQEALKKQQATALLPATMKTKRHSLNVFSRWSRPYHLNQCQIFLL
ncbi:LOW QUALITY PROTEIN: RBBP8 N-terminal-like protein [Lacerta agilis]|uniref:LOW QUALITY PROTEIN: RBBP8 N-terminal-like protein n=1 Tax=Lacerta agilis TaxID=80427 RepID=UPI001419D51C|nr:LOW QUALITY PROTEIN: RBBP8 N-terminal-like protein [Lacerta agilis]